MQEERQQNKAHNVLHVGWHEERKLQQEAVPDQHRQNNDRLPSIGRPNGNMERQRGGHEHDHDEVGRLSEILVVDRLFAELSFVQFHIGLDGKDGWQQQERS